MASQKRKLWTDESMEAAYQAVLDGKGLRETSRLYRVGVGAMRHNHIRILHYNPYRTTCFVS